MKQLLIYILSLLFIGNVFAQKINPRTVSYHKVDSLILTITPDKFSSPEELANFINLSFKSDHEKLRAIFRWVTNNISYAYNTSTSPEQVFKSKKTICQGYSELIQYLCQLSKIECVIVTGISKNDIEYLDNPTDSTNHAWNMVTLYEKNYLLDATWAAGYFDDETNTFTKNFNNEYYLTIPETFILQHLPANPVYQLLEKKVSKNIFCSAPSFQNGSVKCELISFNPISAKFDTKKMAQTNFEFEINQQIKDLQIEIIDSEKKLEEEKYFIDYTHEGNKITFYWEFEQIGLFYIIFHIDGEQAIFYKLNVIE